MTFELALMAMKRGKSVRIKSWNQSKFAFVMKGKIYLHNQSGSIHELWELYDPDRTLLSTKDDWEICGEENQPDKSGVSIGELLCKVTANFDEYEQALDKFRCRLEDLREAAEELNGIKLDINIDFDRG